MRRDAAGWTVDDFILGSSGPLRLVRPLGGTTMHDHDEGPETPSAREGPAPGARLPGPPRRPIDATARARIGEELQRHYAQMLALPIPDHLRALLDDLAEGGERESSR